MPKIEIKLKKDDQYSVVVNEFEGGGLALQNIADAGHGAGNAAVNKFEDILKGCVPQLKAIHETLSEVEADETSVELGIRLGASVNVPFLTMGNDADMRVTLTWRKPN